MSLTAKIHGMPKPSPQAVHGMCSYVRKIIANFDEDPATSGLWGGPCKECEGWKREEEEDAWSAKMCYIRAEETLLYAMAILKREGWKAP